MAKSRWNSTVVTNETFNDGTQTERYAAMWSGGKDSCLAIWRARLSGLFVDTVVTFIDGQTDRVRFHATPSPLIRAQADALGVRSLLRAAAPETYETVFKNVLTELRESGYAGVIFGDIHLVNVREWSEQKTRAAGLRHVEPLWAANGPSLLREFVDAGFGAVVTCCELAKLGPSWLGRIIDDSFVEQIVELEGVDPSGEYGEYHSFVFGGPLFSRKLDWAPGSSREENGFTQLDLRLRS